MAVAAVGVAIAVVAARCDPMTPTISARLLSPVMGAKCSVSSKLLLATLCEQIELAHELSDDVEQLPLPLPLPLALAWPPLDEEASECVRRSGYSHSERNGSQSRQKQTP